jgi:hypothetical protein
MDYKKIVREERAKAHASSKKLDDKTTATIVKKGNLSNSSEPLNHDDSSRIEFAGSTANKELSIKHGFSFAPFIFENFRVGILPNLFYIPDIISPFNEFQLLESIAFAGLQKNCWKQLNTRKLQCWGKNIPTDVVKRRDASLPPWLSQISDALVQSGIFEDNSRPDHVLINQYQALEGILHHTDGPLYHDNVAILSLSSTCLMTFRRNLKSEDIGNYGGDGSDGGEVFNIVLQPRSLLIFSG